MLVVIYVTYSYLVLPKYSNVQIYLNPSLMTGCILTE